MHTLNQKIIVYISILNWNKADATLLCVKKLQQSTLPSNITTKLFVVDNGSSTEDWQILSSGLKESDVILIRNEKNLGFSGGHNIVMQKAIDDNTDYAWIVNNDGFPEQDTISQLIITMEQDASCGAISPLIINLDDKQTIDFCGAYHDWKSLSDKRIAYNEHNFTSDANDHDLWLIGAALMFRVKALKEIGLLNENYFAYFEDDEICTRLNRAGWKNRIAKDAIFFHELPAERQAYFYYLTARNELFFWLKFTPTPYRRLIRLRLLDRSVFRATKLEINAADEIKSNACILGWWDGLLGHGGNPANRLGRALPWHLRLIKALLRPFHLTHIT